MVFPTFTNVPDTQAEGTVYITFSSFSLRILRINTSSSSASRNKQKGPGVSYRRSLHPPLRHVCRVLIDVQGCPVTGWS